MTARAFCEQRPAGSPIHVRRVGPEGPRPSGAPGVTSLCGQPIRWDIVSVEPTAGVLDDFHARAKDNPWFWVCVDCDAAFRASVGAP